MSNYSSSADPRSPPFGTATFSSFTNTQSVFSPSRYSYTSSDTPLASSDSDGATSDHRMRRVNVSPTRSGRSYDSYSEENSMEERAQVEATLNDLDDQLDNTEDILTEWSRGTGPSSYTGTTPSYSTSLDTYSIYNREGNRLSTISERTENVPSRPVSHLRDSTRLASQTPEAHRVSAHRISAASPGHLHSRSVTDLTSDRPVGRRTGDLIAFFEDRASPSDASFGHSRTSSMPGNRVHSPFFPHSQSTPYLSSITGYGSRPSSPVKSKAGSTISTASDALSSSSLLAPPARGPTTTITRSGTQLSPSDFSSTFTSTFAEARSMTDSSAISRNVSSLRRPQTSPRSPLTSVRNIVEAWKERASSQSSAKSTVPSPAKPEFGLRRRTSRVERGQQPSADNAGSGPTPTTPKSGMIPPPFDMTELGPYARDSREPLRIGDLWYLNVHSGPPYRWQRCEALLYPHMLLLSWIAPGGGRGVVTLDLINCTEVRSVPSPSHPSAREDVGTIAARAQIAEGNCPPLMELLCPFQLLYGDGVERLAAESARARVRWVSAIWEALDRSVTLPSRSEPGSPTGSIRTIRSIVSTNSASGTGSGSGSASTVFMPPLHAIPSLSDLSDSLSTGSLSRAPSFPPHRTRTTDDTAVSNQSYLYPGDSRVIAPSRSSSLRRTSSLTDLDEEFASAVSRARNAKPGLGFGLSLVGGAILGDGSPVTVSSGPRLSGEVRVTPPPSGKAKSRPLSDISEDNFFSAGSRTSSSEPRTTTSSFYTMSDTSTSSFDARPTTTDLITDETALEFTSGGSNTQIVPSTLSYRRTESNSYLGDSHDGSFTYSSYTSTSPSSLSRSPGIRRRRYSRSYISDKENTSSGYTASQSRSTLSTWTRSRSATPTPAPSTAALSALEIPDTSGSEGYETANSPSTASFKSLPSIPSETDYMAVEPCKTEASTDFYTVERCASDISTEYVTAEKCKTETETEYETAAICECPRSEQSETHFETASLCKTIPSEQSTPRSLVVDLPVEKAPTPPPKTPTEVPSLQSPESDIHLDIPPESIHSLPLELSPSTSSVSRDLEADRAELPTVPLSSIVGSDELSMSLPSTVESSSEEESSRIPSLSSTESSEFAMGDLPVSEESLPSPAPLPTTTTPSIHPSQWASETDISYESSQLLPTPLTQALHIQDGRDASFETSFMRPSVSPLTSFGSLTAVTETITTSVVSESLPAPAPPPPPPPFLPVSSARSIPSPSSGPTPLSITSTSSSLSRTPSTVSTVSSLSTRSLEEEDVVSLADVPPPSETPPSEVSTEPSLLSSLRSSSVSSVHYYPHPTMVPLPESPAPFYSPAHSPAPSPSVSVSTPKTERPSIQSVLETEPAQTQTYTERAEVITQEIDRVLHHIRELDRFRGQETQEIAENVREIRDELFDLSEYVRTHLVETERAVVTERPEPPPIHRRDQSIAAISISEHRDQSVSAMSVASEPRATPAGPRTRPGLVPIPITPPPIRRSSFGSSSSTSSMSFLSSHHSDDFSILGTDEEEMELPPPSPAWPSESSPPSSELTPSIISSSESSPGPTLSLTSSSSSPTPPPSSPTPSTESSDSSITARPPEPGITLTTIRDMLSQLREQTSALWEGQSSTNHMLDELRQTRPMPQDNTEVLERLHRIESLIETLIDRQATTLRDVRDVHEREIEQTRIERETSTHIPERPGASVIESEDQTDVDSFLSRWEEMMRRRDRRVPLHMPAPRQPGPSLDEQLMELLNVPPAPVPSDIQPPPQLIPFVYQPAPRPSRSRSTSPVLRQTSAPPLPRPGIWSPESPYPPLRPPYRPPRPFSPRRPQEPVPRETAPPESSPRQRPEFVTHDAPPTPRTPREPAPERRPVVQPPGPFLPESLYDRPPTAPATLGGGEPPPGSYSWYRPPRAPGGVVPPPPPGAVDGRQPGGAQAQGPAYVPMPPGPTVVQVPLFDTLMAILREHRLAQLATVDQQRELMRYMADLNDWLARDVQDRQAELRSVTARIDQLRADLGRLGPGVGPGIPMPQPPLQPQPGAPVEPVVGQPFVVPPPGVPGPIGFVPIQPPVMPGMERSPDESPVIPRQLPEWGIPMPDPAQYGGSRGGPVIPGEQPYEGFQQPGVYVHHPPEGDERVIPATPSDVTRSPIPVPGHGTIIVPPSHEGRDSMTSTPTQETYFPPPASPGAIPVPVGGVMPIPVGDGPPVVPVPHSPLHTPRQTIVNIPGGPIPPPGVMVAPSQEEPIIARPGQPVPGVVPGGIPLQPGLPGTIVIQPPPAMPVPESPYGPPPVVRIPTSREHTPVPVPVTMLGTPSARTHEVSRSPPHGVSRTPTPRSHRRVPSEDRGEHDGARSRSRSPRGPSHGTPRRRREGDERDYGPRREYSPERYPYGYPRGRSPERYPYYPYDRYGRPYYPYDRYGRPYSPADRYPRPPSGERGYERPYSPRGERDGDYPESGHPGREGRDRDRPRRPDREGRDRPESEGDEGFPRRPRDGDRPETERGYSPEDRGGRHGRRPSRRSERDGEYSPEDRGERPGRRPSRRSERDGEYSPEDRGERPGRRPSRRSERDGEYSPEDEGRGPPRRRPSDEHDAGDRPRATPSEARSVHGPVFAEGDTAIPHPSAFAPIPIPPSSPAAPTIIRIGGDPRTHRPFSPEERLAHELSHVPRGEPYYPTMPSERGGPRDRPEHPPRRTPSTPGDERPPTRGPSRGAAPPSMIEEEEAGRPPSEMIPRVPAPGEPQGPPHGPDDEAFQNALREHQERLIDAERQLSHIAHDAQDAEDRREREFRDNEDARERIFLDNEDRRDAEARQRGEALFNELEDRIANVPQIPPIPVPPPPEQDQDRHSIIDSIHSAAQDAASRHASEILEIVRSEREEMARERESLAAERERERSRLDEERRLLDDEREAKIAALEEELARTRAELDSERQLRMTEADEARMAASERDEALRNQLTDITNMVQQNQQLCEEKRAIMDQHWAEKQRWKEERDGQMQELLGMVARLADEQAAARQREEEQRLANEGKPGIEQVMEELQRQNAEQRELLNTLSDSWRADSNRQHEETISAVRATANEQVPYNVQGYLDEFSKALAAEVRMLLVEVGKLREERRSIQHELGYLMMMKSKYGPGGEFDPDWKPPGMPGPPPPPPPPPDVPPPPEDLPPARPAWRTVTQRSARRPRKRQEAPPPPEPVPEPRQAHSWVTWHPNPALAPTPPSVEPTLLVPDHGSPGLFGPRSPRSSYHRG